MKDLRSREEYSIDLYLGQNTLRGDQYGNTSEIYCGGE